VNEASKKFRTRQAKNSRLGSPRAKIAYNYYGSRIYTIPKIVGNTKPWVTEEKIKRPGQLLLW